MVGCSGSGSGAINDTSIQAFLNGIKIDGNYGLKDLPWYLTKNNFVEQLTLDVLEDPADGITDRILTEGNLIIPAEIEQIFIYSFQDDQLLSMSYWFITSDEHAYSEFATEVGKPLYDLFGEPRSTKASLDMFDQPLESADKQSKVFWIGEDNSYLEINLGRDENEDYVLIVAISSPRPSIQSLAPEL